MATTAMDYENANGERFEEEAAPRYDRDRSCSPRRDDGHDSRRRSASPNGNDRAHARHDSSAREEEAASNPGSNLFVTGIHPKLDENDITRLFEKYGEVEKAQIMKDPHTGEPRGFGFVKMATSDQADAARDGLQGEVIEGRTLSIEKARRCRPRSPTPGRYFGAPKREMGGRGGRFDDRRRGGYGGGGGYGRDDSYRGYRGGGGGYGRDDRAFDRGYDRSYDRPREDRGYSDRPPREDRGYSDRSYREDRGYDRRDRDYDGAGRSDRYGSSRGGYDDRRGGYERTERTERYAGGDRDARSRDAPAAPTYDAAPRGDAREPYGSMPRDDSWSRLTTSAAR